MTAGALDVLIAGKLAGTLSQDGAGSLSFAYERGYRGVPLSSSKPLSTRPYRDKVVLPYLWGLLPEDPTARRHVAADAGISPTTPSHSSASSAWTAPARCSSSPGVPTPAAMRIKICATTVSSRRLAAPTAFSIL